MARAACSGGSDLAAHLLPGSPPLAGRHTDRLGEIEQVSGAGQEGTAAFDAEDDLVAFPQAKCLRTALGRVT